MKLNRNFLRLLLGVFTLATMDMVSYQALGQCQPCPSPSPSPTPPVPPPAPPGSNDPAFVANDVTKQIPLARQQVLIERQSVKKPTELVATEQARYQAYDIAVKKNPEVAFAQALEVWKEHNSVDLQRVVLFNALNKVASSEESDDLQFMLKALDAPEVQRQECARLGRGNRLEKLIASKRITLLDSNPSLQEKKNWEIK